MGDFYYIDEAQALWCMFLIQFRHYAEHDMKEDYDDLVASEKGLNHLITNYEIAVQSGYDVCMDEGDFSENMFDYEEVEND